MHDHRWKCRAALWRQRMMTVKSIQEAVPAVFPMLVCQVQAGG